MQQLYQHYQQNVKLKFCIYSFELKNSRLFNEFVY
jgi:hypothetical protein